MSELDKIDVHHGSHSANPPYTSLRCWARHSATESKPNCRNTDFDEFHPGAAGISRRTASALRLALRLKAKLL